VRPALRSEYTQCGFEAHDLPFADGFSDAIVSLDAFHYFGTDVHYLEFHMLKHLKPGGQIGIVSPAGTKPPSTPPPLHIREEWYWMNTVAWMGTDRGRRLYSRLKAGEQRVRQTSSDGTPSDEPPT
jgi:cyclopropane fatty-acyl-phospholipid synthase-like methyltransferase